MSERKENWFIDTAGRRWILAIGIARAELINQTYGFNIFSALDDNWKPLRDLLKEPWRLANVLHMMVTDPDGPNSGPFPNGPEFAKALTGGTVLSKAGEALVECLLNFFHGSVPEAFSLIREKSEQASDILLAEDAEAIRKIDPKQAAKMIRQHGNNWLGKLLGNLESTPAD